MEFPRQNYFLSLGAITSDTHWNLSVAIPIHVFQFPRLRQKYGIVTAAGNLRTFEVEKSATVNSVAGFIEEKRWENNAFGFLGNLPKQKAINIVMKMQNNPDLPVKITLCDIFKCNDLIDIFSVCLADESDVSLGLCTSFAFDASLTH